MRQDSAVISSVWRLNPSVEENIRSDLNEETKTDDGPCKGRGRISQSKDFSGIAGDHGIFTFCTGTVMAFSDVYGRSIFLGDAVFCV